jgi:hypothetical protein
MTMFLIGSAVGVLVGIFIPTLVRKAKQKLEQL